MLLANLTRHHKKTCDISIGPVSIGLELDDGNGVEPFLKMDHIMLSELSRCLSRFRMAQSVNRILLEGRLNSSQDHYELSRMEVSGLRFDCGFPGTMPATPLPGVS